MKRIIHSKYSTSSVSFSAILLWITMRGFPPVSLRHYHILWNMLRFWLVEMRTNNLARVRQISVSLSNKSATLILRLKIFEDLRKRYKLNHLPLAKLLTSCKAAHFLKISTKQSMDNSRNTGQKSRRVFPSTASISKLNLKFAEPTTLRNCRLLFPHLNVTANLIRIPHRYILIIALFILRSSLHKRTRH